MSPKFPAGYYVYQLVDPRTGLPFYVGKGKNGRAWQHQRAVQLGDRSGNERKVAKILSIVAAGLDVEIRVVAEYDLESDALDHEYRLVDADPTLTNIHPGGGGKQPSLLLEMRRKKLEALREKEREIALKLRLEERLESWRVSDRHRDEVASWIAEVGGPEAVVRMQLKKSISTRQAKADLAAFRAKAGLTAESRVPEGGRRKRKGRRQKRSVKRLRELMRQAGEIT